MFKKGQKYFKNADFENVDVFLQSFKHLRLPGDQIYKNFL